MSVPKIQIEETLEGVGYESGSESATDDHLRNLKALTEKLRLETRRPSYLEWKAKLEGLAWRSHPKPPAEEDSCQSKKPAGENAPLREVQIHVNGGSSGQEAMVAPEKINGFGNIDEALNWLRKELQHDLLPSGGQHRRAQPDSLHPTPPNL
uniref:Family with sequence similarity 167 member A n=1 Tax=Salvator merianae TaxID=96440 RepID=A0A8D0BCH9_SALMN